MPRVYATIEQGFTFPGMSNDVERALDEGIITFVKFGAKYMQSIIPVKTGVLHDSIYNNKSEIWTVAEHYKFIDQGVKPHRIEGNPLRFMINGVEIFSTNVFHPGIKAHNITDETVDFMLGQVHVIARKLGAAV